MTVLHAEKFLVEEKSKDDEEDLATVPELPVWAGDVS